MGHTMGRLAQAWNSISREARWETSVLRIGNKIFIKKILN